MQKIRILAVGSLKSDWIKTGCQDYFDRLKRQIDLKMLELPPSKQSEAIKIREEESERILKNIKSAKGEVWLLDEAGEQFTSKQFALEIGKSRDMGKSITFIIGGAYGVDDSINKQADKKLSLSKTTMPHELVRPVFLEQLYRATEILKGSGYHH